MVQLCWVEPLRQMDDIYRSLVNGKNWTLPAQG